MSNQGIFWWCTRSCGFTIPRNASYQLKVSWASLGKENLFQVHLLNGGQSQHPWIHLVHFWSTAKVKWLQWQSWLNTYLGWKSQDNYVSTLQLQDWHPKWGCRVSRTHLQPHSPWGLLLPLCCLVVVRWLSAHRCRPASWTNYCPNLKLPLISRATLIKFCYYFYNHIIMLFYSTCLACHSCARRP